MKDEAWEIHGQSPTNKQLTDGCLIVTNSQTTGEGRNRISVPAGTSGVVIHARTAKLRNSGGSKFFANVDVTVDGDTYRIRVPHGALNVISKKGN